MFTFFCIAVVWIAGTIIDAAIIIQDIRNGGKQNRLCIIAIFYP